MNSWNTLVIQSVSCFLDPNLTTHRRNLMNLQYRMQWIWMNDTVKEEKGFKEKKSMSKLSRFVGFKFLALIVKEWTNTSSVSPLTPHDNKEEIANVHKGNLIFLFIYSFTASLLWLIQFHVNFCYSTLSTLNIVWMNNPIYKRPTLAIFSQCK